MEPLAALSVACNVLQLIESGLETVSLTKQIYDKGSSLVVSNLQEQSNHLRDVADEVRKSTAVLAQPITENEQKLWSIAQDCSNVAAELLAELFRLKERKQKSIHSSIYLALKTIKHKPKISALERTLAHHRSTLQTVLLARLFTSDQLRTIQGKHEFELLDERLRHLIEKCEKPTEESSSTIHKEQAAIKSLIVSEHARQTESLQTTTEFGIRRRQLLASLRTGDANSRKNEIHEPHENTFQWIFDEDLERPWHSFSGWLRSTQGLYWINGKAGSGKSTLMKFILEDPETLECLASWSHSGETMMLSFFFWNLGSMLQRSSKGLLCSLLHQLCSQNQVALEVTLNNAQIKEKHDVGDWSLSELSKLLTDMLNNSTQPVFILVDGLDEIDAGEGAGFLIDLVKGLHRPGMVKICVSSRPEQRFIDAFSTYPRLRLQDLTRDDIHTFVSSSLSEIVRERTDQICEHEKMSSIAALVVEKASGVFLWVFLAMKSIRKGVEEDNDLDELHKRVDRLPKDIRDLYIHMWNRLNDDIELYRADAAKFFRTMLVWPEHGHRRTPSLLEFAITMDNDIPDVIIAGKATAHELVRKCQSLEKRITIRCAGILEVYDQTGEDKARIIANGPGHYHRYVHIQYLHRSARDFLLDVETGGQILSHCSIPTAGLLGPVVRSKAVILLATGNVVSADRMETMDCEFFFDLLDIITLPSNFCSESQVPLLDCLRRSWQLSLPLPSKKASFAQSVASYRKQDREAKGIDFLGLVAGKNSLEYVRRHVEDSESGVTPDYLNTLLTNSLSGLDNFSDLSDVPYHLIKAGASLHCTEYHGCDLAREYRMSIHISPFILSIVQALESNDGRMSLDVKHMSSRYEWYGPFDPDRLQNCQSIPRWLDIIELCLRRDPESLQQRIHLWHWLEWKDELPLFYCWALPRRRDTREAIVLAEETTVAHALAMAVRALLYEQEHYVCGNQSHAANLKRLRDFQTNFRDSLSKGPRALAFFYHGLPSRKEVGIQWRTGLAELAMHVPQEDDGLSLLQGLDACLEAESVDTKLEAWNRLNTQVTMASRKSREVDFLDWINQQGLSDVWVSWDKKSSRE